MMYLRAVLVTLLFPLFTCAQQAKFSAPDYKAIQRLTSEKESRFSLDSLLLRFRAADTTLTLQENRLLYYGYLVSPLFTESRGGTAWDSVRVRYKQDTLSAEDWRKVGYYAKLAVDTAPFSIRAINAQRNAAYYLGDTLLFKRLTAKRDDIVDAVFSSGDGKTDSTALHVIGVDNEYDILSLLDLESKSQSLTRNLCDYLELEENRYHLKGLYFDVGQLFKVRERLWGLPTVPATVPRRSRKK